MDRTTILLANILSVAAAALFSGAMIQLVVQDTLHYYLADQKFQILVLIGGVLLGLIVLLRILSLASSSAAHDHHHHDGPCDHDHHDEHTHAPSLWRLIVLAVPLMIIFLGVPKEGFSAQGLKNRLSAADLASIAAVGDTSLPPGFVPKGEPVDVDWRVLFAAATDPQQREYWQNRAVMIVGQYISDPRYEDRYRLMRVKITCCAADAVPLSLTVLGRPPEKWPDAQWIAITGAVDFVEVKSPTGGMEVFPIVYQLAAEKTEARPYLQ